MRQSILETGTRTYFMNIATTEIVKTSSRHVIWLVGVSFVLFQFFLQLSSGVVIGSIMSDMHLSALTAGLLSGAFYVVYTALQIPVGILFDRKDTRTLLVVNVLLLSLGCFIFAASDHLLGLFLGRLIIGAGSAFAFIGLSHLLRQHYPLKQFAFMIGLSETLGFITTMLGMVALGALVSQWGWRGFINSAGLLGLVITYLTLKHIPANTQLPLIRQSYHQQLLTILINKKAWINGIFVGLSFTVVTVFGALWAVPFIEVKLNCGLKDASTLTAMFFLGTALSCPLFGFLSARLAKRRPLILCSCLSTTILLLTLIYIPIQTYTYVAILMFFIGICCGAYMLAYTVANELAPVHSLSTCTGFTNTLAVVTTPLFQPLIGYLLDVSNGTGIYTIKDYQNGLLLIPLSLLLAGMLVFFLPEKA
jgi:MFS family permease